MERFDLSGELQRIAAEYRHLHNDHNREGIEGSWRRRLQAQMEVLDQRFEALLTRWVRDEELCQRWRDHLRHRGAEPPTPSLAEPPLFLGIAETGSRVELRQLNDGYGIFFDGALGNRLTTGIESALNGGEHLVLAG